MKSIIKDDRRLLDLMYPLYKIVEFAQDVDPNVVIGHGTVWERFAPGRVTVGSGTVTDSRGESRTFDVGETGGEFSHAHGLGDGYAMIVQSSNNYIANKFKSISGSWNSSRTTSIDVGTNATNDLTTGTELGGATDETHNVQPFVAVSRWYRTA